MDRDGLIDGRIPADTGGEVTGTQPEHSRRQWKEWNEPDSHFIHKKNKLRLNVKKYELKCDTCAC